MSQRGKVSFVLLVIALIMAIPVLSAAAQGTTVVPNENAQISFPPPVYVLCGELEIRGSANLPNMTNYFISYRPLGDDLQPEGTEFLPALLPQIASVSDDVLGSWDTSNVDDGLYELRLTVNVRGAQAVTSTISPLRVGNELPICETEVEVDPPLVQTQVPAVAATAQPTLTVVPPTTDPTPRVTPSNANANVRTGDSTAYPAIASLNTGQFAVIVGISSRGTGWYQVRLPNGSLGWMSPTVVTVSGNLTGVPSVVPPPLPATPIPTLPPIPPTSTSQANLVAGVVVFDPGSPTCAQTFTVGFDVANLGSQQTLGPGIVSLSDARAVDGAIQGTTIGGFPVLLPNQTFRVNMPLTISTYYNELHRITLTIDSQGQIPESVEGDNTRVVEYTLQRGSCP